MQESKDVLLQRTQEERRQREVDVASLISFCLVLSELMLHSIGLGNSYLLY